MTSLRRLWSPQRLELEVSDPSKVHLNTVILILYFIIRELFSRN